MSNDNRTDDDRQNRQQAQPARPSTEHDTKKDQQHQEQEGKGKIATSSPGGSKSDGKRL